MAKTIRKTFLFPPSGIDLLLWLRKEIKVKTDADVVRYAIGALVDLMMALKSGDTIVIRARDGSERSYHPIWQEDVDEGEVDPVAALDDFRPTKAA